MLLWSFRICKFAEYKPDGENHKEFLFLFTDSILHTTVGSDTISHSIYEWINVLFFSEDTDQQKHMQDDSINYDTKPLIYRK